MSTAGGQNGAGKSPLWAVLIFSWVSSLGTGVATNGIYYMTRNSFGFSDRENYGLALSGGLAYIVGAAGAGWLLRRLRARAGMSTRASLGAVLVAMAALCLLPLLTAPEPGTAAARWPMWVLMILYQPLTGVLWPVVAHYLAGGRSGADLRSSLGRWNITWSSALLVALSAMGAGQHLLGPARSAPVILAALSGLHLGSIFLLLLMGPEPGAYLPHE